MILERGVSFKKYWCPGPRPDQFHHLGYGISSSGGAMGIFVFKLPRWFKCLRASDWVINWENLEGKSLCGREQGGVYGSACLGPSTNTRVCPPPRTEQRLESRLTHFFNPINHSTFLSFHSFLLLSLPFSFPSKMGPLKWPSPSLSVLVKEISG